MRRSKQAWQARLHISSVTSRARNNDSTCSGVLWAPVRLAAGKARIARCSPGTCCAGDTVDEAPRNVAAVVGLCADWQVWVVRRSRQCVAAHAVAGTIADRMARRSVARHCCCCPWRMTKVIRSGDATQHVIASMRMLVNCFLGLHCCGELSDLEATLDSVSEPE